ncbi:hypothetical protein GCM10010368_46110 [Streptomyces roseiscleroticus]|uniref:Uncharacterized protein n=1 Tax=Streptomyces roseiscleroticus TaxID=1972 RepID=A0ABN3EVH6_9ACTN
METPWKRGRRTACGHGRGRIRPGSPGNRSAHIREKAVNLQRRHRVQVTVTPLLGGSACAIYNDGGIASGTAGGG